MHQQWFAHTAAKDLDGLMQHIAPDIVSYEHAGPLQYVGIANVREVCRRGLEASPGAIEFDVPDLTVRACGDLAVAWGLDRITADGVETRSRATRVFQRRDGSWQMTHQHLSVPVSSDDPNWVHRTASNNARRRGCEIVPQRDRLPVRPSRSALRPWSTSLAQRQSRRRMRDLRHGKLRS